MYQIDKEVDMPANNSVGWGTYPFRQMEVGDSFAVPKDKLGSVRQGASRIKQLIGRRFRVLKTDAGEYRCWRVE